MFQNFQLFRSLELLTRPDEGLKTEMVNVGKQFYE